MDQRAGRKLRISHRAEVSRFFEGGRRLSDALLTILALPQEGAAGGRARFGVAVSRKHGGAVQRNRAKRMCREASRLIRDELPAGWNFMLVPRPGARLTIRNLQASLRGLAARVTREKAT